MPLPSPLVGLTIRAKLLAADSSAMASAKITLTPTVPATSPAGDVLLTVKALEKTTAADGTAEWTDVLATDSPGLSNRVPYSVTIVDSAGKLLQTYTVELLSSQAVGGVLRLDDVAAATPPVPLASYVLQPSVGTVGGPAGPLDAGGKVPAAQIPASGSTVPTTRLVSTQNGLQGGGDLSADRTLSPVYGSTANTVCQGNDARLSDARTPLAHTHPTTDVTGLQTALDGAELHPLSGRGYHSASVELGSVRASSSFAAWHTRIWVPATKAITKVGMVITAAGTLGAGGLNGFAFYADDGATKLGESLDDDNFWAVTGERSVNMQANIAAQSTGRFVRCLANVEGYSVGPSVAFAQAQHSAVFNGSATLQRRSAFTSPVSSWPATINPDTLGTPTEFLPLIFLG